MNAPLNSKKAVRLLTEKGSSIQKEAEKIAAQTGRYIAPYKLACMSQTAAKILKVIMQESFAMSYEDCHFILSIVENNLKLATGGVV